MLHRKTLPLLLMTALAATAPLGCDLLSSKPDVENAQSYEIDGLRFAYPGNWKAKDSTETIEGTKLRTVEIEGSSSALAMILDFQPPVPVDPDQMLADFTSGLQEGAEQEVGGLVNYGDGSSEDIERELLGQNRPGKRKRFTLSLLGQSLPHTTDMYFAELPGRTVVVFVQAPDEDLAKVRPGFEQVLSSLKTD